MPIHRNANRSHSNSNTARSAEPGSPVILQPISRPPSMMTSRSATELVRSAPARPRTTALDEIGIERKRSVTPFCESVDIAVIVPSSPKSIVSANIPGRRKAM
jgi:hypothetical protein